MTTRTHSERAIEVAVQTLGARDPRTAALVLFFGAAKHLADTIGQEGAAEIAYQAADHIATGAKR